jgi:hypothetical protein
LTGTDGTKPPEEVPSDADALGVESNEELRTGEASMNTDRGDRHDPEG